VGRSHHLEGVVAGQEEVVDHQEVVVHQEVVEVSPCLQVGVDLEEEGEHFFVQRLVGSFAALAGGQARTWMAEGP